MHPCKRLAAHLASMLPWPRPYTQGACGQRSPRSPCSPLAAAERSATQLAAVRAWRDDAAALLHCSQADASGQRQCALRCLPSVSRCSPDRCDATSSASVVAHGRGRNSGMAAWNSAPTRGL